MNVDIIRIATKRVVVGMSAKDDNTDIVLAKMNAIRKANQAKIDRAKRNARLRKEQALLKKMAAFFREKDDGSNFVHPLDLMNKEVEMEEERIEMVENGLLPSDAKVLGKPWYDFLGGSRNIGKCWCRKCCAESTVCFCFCRLWSIVVDCGRLWSIVVDCFLCINVY